MRLSKVGMFLLFFLAILWNYLLTNNRNQINQPNAGIEEFSRIAIECNKSGNIPSVSSHICLIEEKDESSDVLSFGRLESVWFT
jgi:hypothetical protein